MKLLIRGWVIMFYYTQQSHKSFTTSSLWGQSVSFIWPSNTKWHGVTFPLGTLTVLFFFCKMTPIILMNYLPRQIGLLNMYQHLHVKRLILTVWQQVHQGTSPVWLNSVNSSKSFLFVSLSLKFVLKFTPLLAVIYYYKSFWKSII